MEFTGERYEPQIHGNIELEHLHRYLLASEIVAGKTVLDIASGEGYGSAMLAVQANKVTGVDISSEAIKHARNHYKKENLDFIVGSCTDIPLSDASVDLVVSFETIEHHDQHDKMMKEIKRVLRPNGTLLISSPDKYYYSIETGYRNPYHKKELYQHEFKELLGDYFKNITYFGQRVVFGSSMLSELIPTTTLSYFMENETIKITPGITRPTYWIALASDIQLSKLASSFFEQPINESEVIRSWSGVVSERDQTIQTLTAQAAEREQIVQTLTAQVAERDQAVQALTAQLAERDQAVQGLTAQLAERDQAVQALNAQLAERDQTVQTLLARVAEINSSTTWKIALLFRQISVLIAPQNSLRARLMLLLIKVIYFPFKKIGRYRRLKQDLDLIRYSGLFDADWYLSNYPDVAKANVDPLLHYLRFGGFEGRDPSANFSSNWYLNNYRDVLTAGINPLLHFVKYGITEGRVGQRL